MARVLFVYSIDGHRRFDRRPLSTAAIQLGISYISALLRQHGHETRLVVLESKRGRADFSVRAAKMVAARGAARLARLTRQFAGLWRAQR